MKFRELRRFVRVFDVDRLARERREAGDRRERFRNADLLRHVADFGDRVELLVFRVDRVDGKPLGIEQLEDAILQRHQDLRNRLVRRRQSFYRDRCVPHDGVVYDPGIGIIALDHVAQEFDAKDDVPRLVSCHGGEAAAKRGE